MQWFKGLRALWGAVTLAMSAAAGAQLALQPVLSGLEEPRFVTHAGDGSGRLFYTRPGDNALVIAEHRVTGQRNRADPAGRPLLVIDHPTHTNHNGGMLAFGGDGHLYIATGDGGGANDPGQNAQNIESLLGKILRIDVDRSDPLAGTAYAAPLDNPYVDGPGRDEIFAIGWRNPWRFSFDRSTHRLWVADVGQAQWEEINTAIVRAGNSGWPIYEGTQCLRPDDCSLQSVMPMHQYDHAGGRCSITGGYVYRGTQGVLPSGRYV